MTTRDQLDDASKECAARDEIDQLQAQNAVKEARDRTLEAKVIISLCFAATAWVSGIFGFVAGQHHSEVKASEANFGLRDIDLAGFPECQTDMMLSERWSTRLMYLNGVWTAGCIDEAMRRKESTDE